MEEVALLAFLAAKKYNHAIHFKYFKLSNDIEFILNQSWAKTAISACSFRFSSPQVKLKAGQFDHLSVAKIIH